MRPTGIRLGDLLAVPLLVACAPVELDVSGLADAVGAACELQAADGCSEELACEPLKDGAGVCAVPVELHGQVIDAATDGPIEGARVGALDASGAPVADVAVTDAMGSYVLRVRAVRDASGEPMDGQSWTLTVGAADYLPYPSDVRPSFPVVLDLSMVEAPAEPEPLVVENASTTVELIPLPGNQTGGVTISGSIMAEVPGGALVVAETGMPGAPRTVADDSGGFVLFNVPAGAIELRGYRQGLELQPVALDVTSNDVSGVELVASLEDPAAMAAVSGSVNIVNAPGGSQTSVVLVPSSVFNEAFERGPVPFGLRAPSPPAAPSVDGAFEIAGVPAGTYRVLAAFENDGLVRDPDPNIAGTGIPEITVATGETVMTEEAFKITAALEVMSPGAGDPEEISGTPTFIWADDSGESSYELVVFDALGMTVWEDLMVPGVSGQANAEVPYAGPALEPGMYYQFRATSMKEDPMGGDPTPLSRTEDLRGVFVVR